VSLVTTASPAYGTLQGALLVRVALGFATGATAGAALAMAAGLSRLGENAIDPLSGAEFRAADLHHVHRGRPYPWARQLRQLRDNHLQPHPRRVPMSLPFHWFLPTSGDGRGIVGGGHSIPLIGPSAPSPSLATGARSVSRPPDIEYLAQVARSAEQLGFTGVLTPTGTWCEDAWLVTAALISQTQQLKFLVAFRPGLTSPTLAAQIAATCQRVSRGRLVLNVVTGGEDAEQRRFGDHLSHDQRYARTAEFLDIGGSSQAAGPVAAKYVDVYLTWGEPPDQVAKKLAWMRGLVDAAGRTLRFGIRLHVITRDTSSEAWGAKPARCWPSSVRNEISSAQRTLERSVSVGQDRMRALHERYRTGGAAADLEIYPNLWADVGLVRGGAGTALVGSHTEVADRIEEYASLGIDEFIFSGYPHLEEAYWFGEGVLPELRRRGLTGIPADLSGLLAASA
jgi:alkanesulfonate monooxygenase